MQELFGRSNIIKRSYDDKNIYIYEDHRTILNILWIAKSSGHLLIPPTIVCFDRHDDFKDPVSDPTMLKKIINSNTTSGDFWSFVEWEMSKLDDDWIKTGMELDLIGDVILIGAEITPNISGTTNTYTSQNGKIHHLYSVGHIWSGFSHQGWLIDWAQNKLYKPIWDLLGWENKQSNYKFNSASRKAPLILDFDLDCFSTEHTDLMISWREDIFFNLFNKPISYDYSPQTFLLQLFQEASFTTIAKESECFSYLNESAIVFGYLNELLFNNSL